MSIFLPTKGVQIEFEQYILQGWHEAHGADGGRICSFWREGGVVVMIEDVLFKAERLLTQSEQGKVVLEQYVQELLGVMVEEQAQALSHLLQREIVSTNVSADMLERRIMFIFQLAE